MGLSLHSAPNRHVLALRTNSRSQDLTSLRGDGGNRTHVRGRVMDSFYERSQCSCSRLEVAALTGLFETSLLKCPGRAGGARYRLARFLSPDIQTSSRVWAERSLLPSSC